VDASGCESRDNGGKGNQTAPTSGPRHRPGVGQTGTGRAADGISNSAEAAAETAAAPADAVGERFRDKPMVRRAAVPAARYLARVKPGEQSARSTLVHDANSSIASCGCCCCCYSTVLRIV